MKEQIVESKLLKRSNRKVRLMKGGTIVNQLAAEELIEKAVKTVIREYDKEQKQEQKRKALHNTKLLLKNYNKIQASIEGAVSEAKQIEQDYVIVDDHDKLYIESIRRSKLKSLIVIAHIDKALDTVYNECLSKGTIEKYEAFKSCLMESMSYEDAAIVYHSSKPSISRWINDITRDVSIQLFGIEGITLS